MNDACKKSTTFTNSSIIIIICSVGMSTYVEAKCEIIKGNKSSERELGCAFEWVNRIETKYSFDYAQRTTCTEANKSFGFIYLYIECLFQPHLCLGWRAKMHCPCDWTRSSRPKGIEWSVSRRVVSAGSLFYPTPNLQKMRLNSCQHGK